MPREAGDDNQLTVLIEDLNLKKRIDPNLKSLFAGHMHLLIQSH